MKTSLSGAPNDPDSLELASVELPRNIRENRKRLNSLIEIEKNELDISLIKNENELVNKVDSSSSDKSNDGKVKVKNKVKLW